ncbi:hypothetical protein VTH82DRAFT_1801 [Thermothelomyces myriococcoides]
MYYVFGAFNAAAFIHMTLFAPETKGFTLEEMDEVFESGRPAWKKYKKRSRLDELQQEIEAGNLKINVPVGGEPNTAAAEPVTSEKKEGSQVVQVAS